MESAKRKGPRSSISRAISVFHFFDNSSAGDRRFHLWILRSRARWPTTRRIARTDARSSRPAQWRSASAREPGRRIDGSGSRQEARRCRSRGGSWARPASKSRCSSRGRCEAGGDRILRLAFANGVRIFDTAKVYGTEILFKKWFEQVARGPQADLPRHQGHAADGPTRC